MGQKSTILAVGLIIFAVILVILFIVSRVMGGGSNDIDPAKSTSENNIQKVESVEQAIENNVPVSKILSTPNVYEGYNLSVTSTVAGWATNNAFYFTGESSGLFGGQSRGQLLVITNQAFQLPQDSTDDRLGLGEITKITVLGKLVIMNREQLESALGVNLDDPKLELGNQAIYRWNLGPVLLMDSYLIPESS